MNYRIWSLSLLAATCGLIVVAGCTQDKPSGKPAAAPPAPQVAAYFVGNDACKGCHPDAFRDHAATRHMQTLREATRQEMGSQSPPTGKIPDSDMTLQEASGKYAMAVEGDSLPIDLAFGSGKTGITYVSILGSEFFEMRKSYFPKKKQWYVTPGHENKSASDLGMMYTTKQAQECVLCHAVTVSTGSVKPEKAFFGVGCESCHGASSRHVEAMKANPKGELYLERLGKWEPQRLSDLCATCHRGAPSVNMQTDQASMTNRFQPYGLSKSKCFIESGKRLTCNTCHNPHKDAETNPKYYEAICLSCHTPGASNAAPAQPPPAFKIVACPVNAREKCVGCHMPSRPVFSKTTLPTEMADHYIRVYKK